MRWWGWGEDADAVELPATAEHLLDLELGLGESSKPRAVRGGPDEVTLPRSALDPGARAGLARVVGDEHVADDHATRVSRAAGRSYPDLLALRRGRLETAPDAVVRPADGAQVAAVLAVCSEAGVAVVPFGGGTSVVGGVDAVRGAHHAAISLDLTRMDRVLDLDRVSLTARFEPGILGPELERRLATAGLSLGHYPQSFEYSTLGGWLATRSAGQASTGLGRIDEMVQAVRCETPSGPIETRDVPASAAGPSLRELVVGSEGTLGVITAATMKLRPLPASRRYEAWSVASFAEGSAALRALAQAGAAPDVSRLSDERETALTVALGSTGSRAERAGRAYLRLRGHDEGCLMIAGFEGAAGDVAQRRGRAAEMLRSAGAVHLGERPGRAWERTRYCAPYLRDALMDRGALVETLETATTWSGLEGTYTAVRDALTESLSGPNGSPLVMCHLSHLYRTGACLYFTFIARAERGGELEQWRAAKRAALDAIVASGATVTHHHAVGRDHMPWMAGEVGETGLAALRALKAQLDPRGIMNPGKLLA
jgi:alkyldihydroxyacetonephosphate synthase